jgi:hypothetical protein
MESAITAMIPTELIAIRDVISLNSRTRGVFRSTSAATMLILDILAIPLGG